MDKCYIISYDMVGEGDAKALHKAIKNYDAWAHITESTWAVVTERSAKKIGTDLSQYLPEGSRLFVVKSGVEAAWQDVICRSQWLKRNL